jgi:hypothetical protein
MKDFRSPKRAAQFKALSPSPSYQDGCCPSCLRDGWSIVFVLLPVDRRCAVMALSFGKVEFKR